MEHDTWNPNVHFLGWVEATHLSSSEGLCAFPRVEYAWMNHESERCLALRRLKEERLAPWIGGSGGPARRALLPRKASQRWHLTSLSGPEGWREGLATSPGGWAQGWGGTQDPLP